MSRSTYRISKNGIPFAPPGRDPTRRPTGFVEQLQADAAKLRSWITSKDQQIAELQRYVKLAQAAREDLRVSCGDGP